MILQLHIYIRLELHILCKNCTVKKLPPPPKKNALTEVLWKLTILLHLTSMNA